jgi:hypothetical protein
MVSDSKVVNGLYRRAIGFEYDEKTVEFNEHGGIERTKVTRKFIPADVKAAIHWLRIRQRENWTQPELSIKHQHEGYIDHKHTMEDIPVHDLNKDEKEFLFSITQKQLASGVKDN